MSGIFRMGESKGKKKQYHGINLWYVCIYNRLEQLSLNDIKKLEKILGRVRLTLYKE